MFPIMNEVEIMNNNFKNILESRYWTIATVQEHTGISRSTLTSIYYQRAKGIQFDTLKKICHFLGITPNDLLGYEVN